MVYKLYRRTQKSYKRIAFLAFAVLSAGLIALIALQPAAVADTAYRWGFRKKSRIVHGANVTRQTGNKPGNTNSPKPQPSVPIPPNTQLPPPIVSAESQDCSGSGTIRQGLSNAKMPVLRKIAEYESVCNAAIASAASFFAPTPRTAAEAQSYAYDISVNLKEFAQYNITPVIFMEPTYNGGILDFNAYRDGAYDAALDGYFASIKAAGITDAAMGRWVLFPEGNIPVWNTVDPSTYAANVTKTAQYIKKHFATAHVSVLLDSMTYPNGTSWSGGQYKSLLPYVSTIPKGLVDSFGLQGFPWTPPANEVGPALLDPTKYLQTDIATEAARSLGVQDVWFNTGSFGVAHNGSAAQRVTIDAATRQMLLSGALNQAKKLQSQGFAVSMHIFAEDKSNVSEAINWSYWPAGQPANGPDAVVFKTFVHDLKVANIPLWLFDTK